MPTIPSRFIQACCLLALLTFSAASQAHPHVWIDYAATAQLHGQKLVAVRETWTFSKGFPVSMVGDFSGMTKSGPVDETHTAMFKVQAFSSLKGADYFTHIYLDGKPVALGEPRDFSVSIEDGHIVYHFVVPLAKPQEIRQGALTLGLYDDSFFVDFTSKATLPVSVEPASSTCHTTPFDDHDHAIFGGNIFPQASRLTC